jgi:hypothetical protein
MFAGLLRFALLGWLLRARGLSVLLLRFASCCVGCFLVGCFLVALCAVLRFVAWPSACFLLGLVASLRAYNFGLVCGSCWALSIRYLDCLTYAVASLMLLSCFAPMRLASRSRVGFVLAMAMASLRFV